MRAVDPRRRFPFDNFRAGSSGPGVDSAYDEKGRVCFRSARSVVLESG